MAERYDAFVSYAHGERDFAERLVAVLRGRGISPFIDTAEVRPGEDWAARLEEGLRSAATVLVLLGGEPFGSARTREVDAALELGDRVPVIPVLIPGIGIRRPRCRPSSELASGSISAPVSTTPRRSRR